MHRRNVLASLTSLGTWAFATGGAHSTALPAAVVPPSAWREDVALTERLLRELHPGLWRYQSPAAFDAAVAHLYDAGADADLRQRFLLLSRFLARLRCGHSYCNFYNQRQAPVQALFQGRNRLPLRMAWLEEGLVVTHAAHGVPAGARIVSIQGRSVADWWAALEPLARVDGNNPAKARSLLSVSERNRLESFDVFFGLLAGEAPDGRWTLEVELPGSTTSLQTLSVPAWTQTERHARVPVPAADAPVWTWEMTGTGFAVLRMPGWALYNSRWNWKAWLDERMDDLAQDRSAQGLVVDVRGNEGGLDCGNAILARYLRQPNANPMRRLVRFRSVPQTLRAVLDTWDPGFFALGASAPVAEMPQQLLGAADYFELPAADTTVQPLGRSLRHKPLTVLVDGANSSATFGFAQRIQQAQLGTLVGSPTGGNRRGINGGAFFFVRLPGTGIAFDLPLIGTFSATPQPDGGLQPDRLLLQTRADWAAGRDAALEGVVGG